MKLITHQTRAGLHNTRKAFNSDEVSTAPNAQGIDIDSLGLFGYTDSSRNGMGQFPHGQVRYRRGYTEAQIKPTDPVIELSREQDPVRPVAIGAPYQAPLI